MSETWDAAKVHAVLDERDALLAEVARLRAELEALAAQHEAAWAVVRAYETDWGRPEKVVDTVGAIGRALVRVAAREESR